METIFIIRELIFVIMMVLTVIFTVLYYFHRSDEHVYGVIRDYNSYGLYNSLFLCFESVIAQRAIRFLFVLIIFCIITGGNFCNYEERWFYICINVFISFLASCGLGLIVYSFMKAVSYIIAQLFHLCKFMIKWIWLDRC